MAVDALFTTCEVMKVGLFDWGQVIAIQKVHSSGPWQARLLFRTV